VLNIVIKEMATFASSGQGSRDTSIPDVSNSPFQEKYLTQERIGKGAYATVHRCTRRGDGKTFAVKNIDVRPMKLRDAFDPERLLREVKITQSLSHPHIVGLEETFWTRHDGSKPRHSGEYERLLLVLEYAPGKELFDEILSRGKFLENDAREVMSKVLSALVYIHSLNIVHRDIKPENILLTNDGGVKLLDFGLSRTVGSGSYAKTFAGTPEYYAPEVDPKRRMGGSNEGYGVKADCWSFGACLYVMLSGIFPEFASDGSGEISFARSSHWSTVSPQAKDLIKQLMNPHPEGRPSSEAVLSHPWFQGKVPVVESPQNLVRGISKESSSQSGEKKRKAERNGSGVMMEVDTIDHNSEEQPMLLQQQYNSDIVYKLKNLMTLQLQIEDLFQNAYSMASGDFKIAISLNAKVSSMQLQKSSAMMESLGQTAAELAEVIDDLKLAVEEGEPELAGEIFKNIQGFVSEMRQRAKALTDENSNLILKLNYTCEAALQKRLPKVADETVNVGDSSDKIIKFAPPLTPTKTSPAPGNNAPEVGRNIQGDDDEFMNQIAGCVEKLSEVDTILQEFTNFWVAIDNVILGVYQKNKHVQSMLNYTHNRKLRDRFFNRLEEYGKLWIEIGQVCRAYKEQDSARVQNAYKFVSPLLLKSS